MGITVHYRASAREPQVDSITEHFNREIYRPKIVDFPFDSRWVKQGCIYQPDYPENWEKYTLCMFSEIIKDRYQERLPDYFKGTVLNIDEGCEPLWFAFGRYSEDEWWCHNFTKTQFAKRGILTHKEAVDLLREFEPMVDYLEVRDEAEYWETNDFEKAARLFGDSERMIKALGKVLKGLAKEHGLSVKTGYELEDEERVQS